MAYSRIGIAVALQRYLDTSPVARMQRELAAILCRSYGAELHVLCVEAPVPLLPDVESTSDKLNRFVAPLLEEEFTVSPTLREGRPSREISAWVKEIEADLLIIGSHSKRGPLDVGLGSTATVLIRDLDTTVLMVRPTAEEQEKAKQLMIPRYPMIFPYG
jgi:nucleotide-binding universal stress UspA family protein